MIDSSRKRFSAINFHLGGQIAADKPLRNIAYTQLPNGVSLAGGIASAETFGNPAVQSFAGQNRHARLSVINYGITGRLPLPYSTQAIQVPSIGAINSILRVSAIGYGIPGHTPLPIPVSAGDQFGIPTITYSGATAIIATGIPSAEAFGTATVATAPLVVANGIVSSETFGATTVAPVAWNVSVPAIPTEEIFGSGVISAGSLSIVVNGIPTEEAFGVTGVANFGNVFAIAIPSDETFGETYVVYPITVVPDGTVSAEAFGSATVSGDLWTISGVSAGDSEAFGIPFITPLSTISLSGIATQELVELPIVVRIGSQIVFTAIDSLEFFGYPNVAVANPPLVALGIESEEAFGLPFAHPVEAEVSIDAGWEVRVYSLSNPLTPVAIVPRLQDFKFSRVLSDHGAGSITINRNDTFWQANNSLLETQNLWVFYWNNLPVGWFVNEDDDEKILNDTEDETFVVQGRTPSALLEWATTLPSGNVNVRNYSNSRAASIFISLLNEAKARGTITNVVPSFSATTDTDGVAWSDIQNQKVEIGSTLFKVLKDMSAIGPFDWEMDNQLRVIAKKTFGRQLDQTVRFHTTKDLVKVGRKRSRRTIANKVWVSGSEGPTIATSDAGSINTHYGRELLVKVDQAKDSNTRSGYANVLLQKTKDAVDSWTITILPDRTAKTVFRDFTLGDWVGVEIKPGIYESQKIVALAFTLNTNGVGCELTTKSRGVSRKELLEKALENLVGSGGISSPDISQPTPTSVPDLNTITAPTNVVVSPGVFLSEGFVSATWTGVSNVRNYEMRATRVSDGVASGAMATESTNGKVTGLLPGTMYDFEVRAVTDAGSIGPWSTPVRFTIGTDSTPPNQVTGLLLTTSVRGLFATWQANTDADVANGAGQYRVDIDTVATFDSVNHRSFLTSATVVSIADLTAQTLYFVRVAAVDSSGNQGLFSATSSATVGMINGATDIAAASIGTAQIATAAISTALIADGAIVNAKIADASITSAKINELTVSRLSGGTLGVQMTLGGSGSILIGSPSGLGLTIDSAGLRLRNAQGTVVVDLSVASGVGTFTGVVSNGTITGGTIAIGTGNAVFKADANGIYLGASSYSSAPFRVSPTGQLYAASGQFSGTISASNFTGSQRLGNSSSDNVQSGGYVAATTGWKISGDGTAEFNGAVTVKSISTKVGTATNWVEMGPFYGQGFFTASVLARLHIYSDDGSATNYIAATTGNLSLSSAGTIDFYVPGTKSIRVSNALVFGVNLVGGGTLSDPQGFVYMPSKWYVKSGSYLGASLSGAFEMVSTPGGSYVDIWAKDHFLNGYHMIRGVASQAQIRWADNHDYSDLHVYNLIYQGALQVSDQRLKELRGCYNHGLDVVNSVQPKRYHWLRDRSHTEQIGFIAQDFPDFMVSSAWDENERREMLAINQQAVIATLWNAVRELARKLDATSFRNWRVGNTPRL